MWSDAGRMFVRPAAVGAGAPAFAVAVISTLALRIGADSAIFNALDAVAGLREDTSLRNSLIDIHTVIRYRRSTRGSSYPHSSALRDIDTSRVANGTSARVDHASGGRQASPAVTLAIFDPAPFDAG